MEILVKPTKQSKQRNCNAKSYSLEKMKLFFLSWYYYTFYHQDLLSITPSVANGPLAKRKKILKESILDKR